MSIYRMARWFNARLTVQAPSRAVGEWRSLRFPDSGGARRGVGRPLADRNHNEQVGVPAGRRTKIDCRAGSVAQLGGRAAEARAIPGSNPGRSIGPSATTGFRSSPVGVARQGGSSPPRPIGKSMALAATAPRLWTWGVRFESAWTTRPRTVGGKEVTEHA